MCFCLVFRTLYLYCAVIKFNYIEKNTTSRVFLVENSVWKHLDDRLLMINGTMNFQDKFMLTKDETFLLFNAFYKEALAFLNVPLERYAEMVQEYRMGAPNGNPIFVDYQRSTIHVDIRFFRTMIAQSSYLSNDGPTQYRFYGYKLAHIWYRYVSAGIAVDYAIDVDSTIFAQALNVVKGLPLLQSQPISPAIKKNLGFDPNDRTPILEMLRSQCGMDCRINTVYDIDSGQLKEVISFTQKEGEARAANMMKLIEESKGRPLTPIIEGDLGSESNPFANVDEAADYILKIEKECLLSDSYRQNIDNEHFYYDFEHNYFRISWASPNVCYYEYDNAESPYFVVNQLSRRGSSQVPRFSLKPSLRNNKFLYRGQAEFYPSCRPSMFRDADKRYYVDDIIQINEMEVLLQEYPLVKLLEQGFYLMHEFFSFKINYVGLSQHYYNRTHLLDLTSEMEVAKFFAVTTFDMDKDCYVEYKGDKLGVLYYFDIKPDTFSESPGRKYVVDAIGKQPFMRSGNQSGFLINMDRDDNFNNFPEVRYVFFRHDKDVTSRIFKASNNGDKYMPEEILRSHWYKRLSDKEERMQISMDALKLNFRNNPNESYSKILKELIKKGYKVSSKYKSVFAETELNQYYEKSIQIWEDFCSNVHFYGPEGMLLKKHLLNLPHDPRYRWAFYRD